MRGKVSTTKISREIRQKYDFVKKISEVITEAGASTIRGVEYEYWVNEESNWRYELVVMHYKGGAFAPRNVSADNLAAIFREIGRLMEGGYYEEVEGRKKLETNAKWQKVDIEKAEIEEGEWDYYA